MRPFEKRRLLSVFSRAPERLEVQVLWNGILGAHCYSRANDSKFRNRQRFGGLLHHYS